VVFEKFFKKKFSAISPVLVLITTYIIASEKILLENEKFATKKIPG